jgi:phosphatidylglycerophosphate synthase
MYFLTALGLFLYQSLDAIDGKQARRTGSSSPLGELFDHGCDSVSTGTLLDIFFFSMLFLFFSICHSCIFLCSTTW